MSTPRSRRGIATNAPKWVQGALPSPLHVTGVTGMSTRRLAQLDQEQARERDVRTPQGVVTLASLVRQDKEARFDRKAQRLAFWFLVVALIIGIYGTLAVFGVLPALPWSRLGH